MGRKPGPLGKREWVTRPLAQPYAQYLQQKCRHYGHEETTGRVRALLCAFDRYLDRNRIQLQAVTIENVDAFEAAFFKGYASSTVRQFRGRLRCFLHYLHHELQILPRDLAPLVVSPRQYADAKPPRFLTHEEVKKLFASLDTSCASKLRTYAIVHLAYTMGLRPIEISRIGLGINHQLIVANNATRLL